METLVPILLMSSRAIIGKMLAIKKEMHSEYFYKLLHLRDNKNSKKISSYYYSYNLAYDFGVLEGVLNVMDKIWNAHMMSHNKGEYLPKEIGQLMYAQKFYAQVIGIRELPFEFCNMVGLTEIYAQCNNIICLPSEFDKLVSLRVLYVPHNRLITLPDSILGLRNLEYIDVSGNNMVSLNSIPAIRLELLCIRHLGIISLPIEWDNSNSLKKVFMQGTELLYYPKWWKEIHVGE